MDSVADTFIDGEAFLEDVPFGSVFDNSFLEVFLLPFAFSTCSVCFPLDVDTFLLEFFVPLEGLGVPVLFLSEGEFPRDWSFLTEEVFVMEAFFSLEGEDFSLFLELDT